MKKICIYGKGGIGKSTVVANVAAAAARDGKRVMVVGCDPKADTTRVLVHGRMETILDAHARTGGMGLTLADVAREGAFGVLCMESGGPRAGPATSTTRSGSTAARHGTAATPATASAVARPGSPR